MCRMSGTEASSETALENASDRLSVVGESSAYQEFAPKQDICSIGNWAISVEVLSAACRSKI